MSGQPASFDHVLQIFVDLRDAATIARDAQWEVGPDSLVALALDDLIRSVERAEVLISGRQLAGAARALGDAAGTLDFIAETSGDAPWPQLLGVGQRLSRATSAVATLV
jgi:hypothetical protein